MLLRLLGKAAGNGFSGLTGKKQLIHPKHGDRSNKKISFSGT